MSLSDPTPGHVISYGLLPTKLFLCIRQKLIDIASSRGAPVVRRTE